MKKRMLVLLMALTLLWMVGCGNKDNHKIDSATDSGPVNAVTYNLDGGTLLSGTTRQLVKNGEDADPPEVERKGYFFDGWDNPGTNIQRKTTITAKWTRSYTVTFATDEGTLAGETVQQVREGEIPTAPEAVPAEGRKFLGWDEEITATTADVTYTAIWRAEKLSAEEVYQLIAPAVVEIHIDGNDSDSIGTGFFINNIGTVVTNYHVIDGGLSGEIVLHDGSAKNITSVKAYDKDLDLAILNTEVTGNEYLTLSEETVRTGEVVYAMGSSKGLTGTFSDGIVSTASREVEGINCIQITAPISNGNSGGPLVNELAEVVGINAMGMAEGQNLNFAIAVSELDQLTDEVNQTLQEIAELEAPTTTVSVNRDEGFYNDADAEEMEYNDIFLLADEMTNGAWIAGAVAEPEDIDYFSFSVDGPCDVTFEVAPSYLSDADYMLCGVLALNVETVELDVLDVLLPSEEGNYTISMMTTVHIEKAGTYYLMVAIDDDTYPSTEPVYYIAQIRW